MTIIADGVYHPCETQPGPAKPSISLRLGNAWVRDQCPITVAFVVKRTPAFLASTILPPAARFSALPRVSLCFCCVLGHFFLPFVIPHDQLRSGDRQYYPDQYQKRVADKLNVKVGRYVPTSRCHTVC